MSLVEKICKELGVEVGEEWENVDGITFKIEKDGLFYKDLTNKRWSKPLYANIHESLLTGELKPMWKPKKEEMYYMPDITVPKLYHAMMWMDVEEDIEFYKKGLIFKTKEEAINMARETMRFIREERWNGRG